MTRSTKTFAVPPGEIIKDFIEPRHMTQRELAIRMNTSEKNLCLLLKGKAPVTPETAQKLEMVFDVPAATWLKMESEYRADLLKVKEELKTEGESEFVVRIGYSALSALGWVPKTKDISEKIINLRKFFEVADLNVICSEKFAVNVALRDARITEKSDLLALAWCQKACIEARQQELGVLNIRKLCSCLKELKPLASRATPDLDGMQQILNLCGIAMVILPPLDGSDIHSASFPYGKTVVMGLTDRRKTADAFCFNFFREAGHIVNGDFYRWGHLTPDDEQKADAFARNFLIPPAEYEAFLDKNSGNLTKSAIKSFAESEGVDSGIVVGMLQNDKRIDCRTYNDLKHAFASTESA